MKTAVPLELLWRAWPEGYVAKRGVMTRRDWQCVAVEPCIDGVMTSWALGGTQFPIPYYEHDPDLAEVDTLSRAAAESTLRRGELLPNVDPKDTATWACLLADLAEAVERRSPARFAADRGLIFNASPEVTNEWRLIGWGSECRWAVDPTHDPALALVWCRIRERKCQ